MSETSADLARGAPVDHVRAVIALCSDDTPDTVPFGRLESIGPAGVAALSEFRVAAKRQAVRGVLSRPETRLAYAYLRFVASPRFVRRMAFAQVALRHGFGDPLVWTRALDVAAAVDARVVDDMLVAFLASSQSSLDAMLFAAALVFLAEVPEGADILFLVPDALAGWSVADRTALAWLLGCSLGCHLPPRAMAARLAPQWGFSDAASALVYAALGVV